MNMDNETKDSIRFVLDHYGVAEARGVVRRLRAGQVDGRRFIGLPDSGGNRCGCLIGSCDLEEGVEKYERISQAMERFGGQGSAGYARTAPAQGWFTFIRPGDTPATIPHAAEAVRVIEEWLAEQVVGVGVGDAPVKAIVEVTATVEVTA